MLIDVYADIVCPWCYIGKRRLDRALALRPDLQVERRWRPFQLRPDMPKEGMAWREFVRHKFGGLEQAQAVFARVTAVGASEGIRFMFDRITSAPNTRDAHRLILFAAGHGRQWEMIEALFQAYFTEGHDLGTHTDLVAIAAGIGFKADEIQSYLAGSMNAAEVQASQDMACQQGITGVPHHVIDDHYLVSGAQPTESLLDALDTMHAKHAY